MEWFINNWTLILTVVIAIVVIVLAVIAFFKLPVTTQKQKIKEIIFNLVVEAEKQFQYKTGELKLAYVYSKTVEKLPIIAKLISFDTFSNIVDECLIRMKELLSNNEAVCNYIYEENEKEK